MGFCVTSIVLPPKAVAFSTRIFPACFNGASSFSVNNKKPDRSAFITMNFGGDMEAKTSG